MLSENAKCLNTRCVETDTHTSVCWAHRQTGRLEKRQANARDQVGCAMDAEDRRTRSPIVSHITEVSGGAQQRNLLLISSASALRCLCFLLLFALLLWSPARCLPPDAPCCLSSNVPILATHPHHPNAHDLHESRHSVRWLQHPENREQARLPCGSKISKRKPRRAEA